MSPIPLATKRTSIKARTEVIAAYVIRITGVDTSRIVVTAGNTVGLLIRTVLNTFLSQVRVTKSRSKVIKILSNQPKTVMK